MEQQCRSSPRPTSPPTAGCDGPAQPQRRARGRSGWLFVVTLLAALLASGLWLQPADGGKADEGSAATLASAARG